VTVGSITTETILRLLPRGRRPAGGGVCKIRVMLMSLLPGLRQLRAPVAAGAVWLLVLWFSGGEELLDSNHRGTLVDSVVKLCHFLGRPISLALLAVLRLSYRIGIERGQPGAGSSTEQDGPPSQSSDNTYSRPTP
jgi:hypothetical protein